MAVTTIAVGLLALTLAAPVAAEPETPRNGNWAAPVDTVRNLYRVTPTLYRSEKIDASMIPTLKQLGIRTVVNLRTSEEDASVFTDGSFRAVHVPINTWDIEDDKVAAALRAIREGEREGPVLVHCLHGADRTGVVVAMYRMLYQGWSRAQASDELKNGGYGFHGVWVNIPRYLDKVDLNRIRRTVADRGEAGA